MRKPRRATEPNLVMDGDYWTARWRDDEGKQRKKRFGKQRNLAMNLFSRWYAEEWSKSPAARTPGTVHTIADAWAVFDHWARGHYVHPDGTPTGTADEIAYAFVPLTEVYGDLPVDRFGSNELRLVRDSLRRADLARTTINHRLVYIRRVFRWLAEHGHCSAETIAALELVPGLRKGASGVREKPRVQPVDPEAVAATCEALAPMLADMVRFQLWTGCRPGELFVMTPAMIDTTGAEWVYKPERHKTAHRGRERRVLIGPRARAVVERWALEDPSRLVFEPQRCTERFTASAFDKNSYAQAIRQACDRAFPAPPPLGRCEGESGIAWKRRLTDEQAEELKAWQRVHRWHPNQLRHTAATLIRSKFGLEASQAILGHAKADVTQIYAERDTQLAARVAAEIG